MVISKSRKKNQRVEKTAPEGPGAQETEKFLPHSSFLVIARDLRLDLTICSLIFKNVLVNHIYLYSLTHSMCKEGSIFSVPGFVISGHQNLECNTHLESTQFR